ncbi:MAG TPA: LytTR family DNA-binding domain-containing protein [Longimicrobium sp.]|nr:LytTR family DNA-binding domain-containing protein [Longimicrobium sp.]
MSAIRVMIVDDEELGRQRVRELLRDEEGFEVVAECADGRTAVELIEELRPELVFLDVQMPGMDGFQVLEALDPATQPVVVFITAFDEFAVKAFEANAVDYLLKPFYRPRFRAAVERARARVEQAKLKGLDRRILSLIEGAPAPAPRGADRFVVRQGARIYFVPSDEVDWMEGEGNYVRLHSGGKSHLIRSMIGTVSERLDPQRFIRVHRSVIVNVEAIKEIQVFGRGTYVLVLRDGHKLRSSATFRAAVEALIADAA